MSAAHVHLLLNHFPIVGGLVVLALLALAWVRRDDTLFRAGLWLVLAITLLGVATYLTGEPAEHVLEARGGFSEEWVEPHEEAAIWALVLYGLLGAGALYALVRYARRAIPRSLGTGLVLLALLAVAAAARVGWLGGKISHEELRGGVSEVVAPD
jgi:uncharacterized membrane protein